ncbi:MAG: peptide-methionine (S)-S-oxide reductase MsrA [Candidatus Neomarinimicrobiota bacterium]|nr:MAG: peptide-methionine (S)-S-oxide reductase [bacterium]|tara:strand:+ start:10536 stop:11069 length:534 start_codon:yes stop_codon:yes gene_type:complete
MSNNNTEFAILGGGCFWCVEAVFERIDGVSEVISGYAGGQTKNPSYKDVTSGKTGHAEVCKVIFDPKIVTYDEVLDIFWQAHDPTTLNRQGADIGTQYRSAIYYIGDIQEQSAKKALNKAGEMFDKPITTEVKELDVFYKAEGYHQDYYENNPNAPYCAFVIAPKIKKLGKKGLWDN